MKILVVEDNAEKIIEIRGVIDEACSPKHCDIFEANTVNDALRALSGNRFDLIVADLVLPQIKGSAETEDATPQWCEHIENHASGRLSSWVVMSGFADIADSARQSFARHGVAVIDYEADGIWRTVLANKIKELFVDPPLDFVVVCALDKERAGLTFSDEIEVGALTSVQGMDCQELALGTFSGVALVLPRAGLISAAIATTKALEIFKPRAVAMCGICAGIQGESELGDLVVPDLSWNYQAGKIVAGELKPELVQTPIPPTLRSKIAQMATDEESRCIRNQLLFEELDGKEIKMLPMVSGSQVVADQAVGRAVTSSSRKVGALDMEVASVYAAAHEFYNGSGIFFAAKTVVDMADEQKNDRYHQYGCAVSARFVARALSKLL